MAPSGVRVSAVERFDTRVDGLFEEAARPFDFAVERHSTWLNWRYCDPRGGASFVRYALDPGGTLVGYAVLRRQRFPPPTGVPGARPFERGSLADLLVLPGRDDVVRVLAGDAVAHFGALGLAVATWLPREHPYRAALLDLGFAATGERVDMQFRPSPPGNPGCTFVDDPAARLHLMPGDTDHV